MKQNLSKIYTIAVIIALIILGGWSAWDVYQLRASNREAAQVNVEQIKSQVERSFNSGTAFTDDSFFKMIRSLFRDNPDLEILTVYSNDDEVGIEYHYNRGEDVELLNLSETTPLNMSDLPEYKYNQLMKTKLTSPLQAQDRAGMELDLIYKVVDSNTIYNILIRLLIVVVVLFFTTLFMIFTVSRRNVEEEEAASEPDAFSDDESLDDDMSLDWDQSAAPSVSPEMDDLSLDDDFSDLDLNDTGGDFAELDLGSDISDEPAMETPSEEMSFDGAPDSDFSFGDDVTDEFSMDEEDLSDQLSLEEPSDDLGFDDVTDELDMDEPSDDFSMGDDLSAEDDFSFGDDVTDDFSMEETDLSDELSLDDDLSLEGDTEEEFSMDDISDDLNPDDEGDDFGDLDFDSDIPQEEDLMAMDHEVTPSSDLDDDFDFDNIEDTFGEEEAAHTDNSPSLYSPKSGVGWESFIEERVNLELERAAAEDQDLVMGLIQCESLTEDNYRIFADQLKEDFNYPDMIFEYKDKGFALIVPHNDLDGALRTLEAFTGKEQSQYGEINVGISSRNGRLITGSRIFMEAENALNKAVEDQEKNIVGFRSDPDKFRDFLSNK